MNVTQNIGDNMTFERFSQLWDELVNIHRGNDTPSEFVDGGMSDATAFALIAYSQGDTSMFDSVKRHLNG